MDANGIETVGDGADFGSEGESYSPRESGRRIEDAIEETTDGLSLTLGRVVDQARATTSKVADQARAIYDRASDTAQGVAETVDPIVQERPYVAVAMGVAAGLLLGLLIGGHGPRVVYVRPRS